MGAASGNVEHSAVFLCQFLRDTFEESRRFVSQIDANIEYGTSGACYDLVIGGRSVLKMEAANSARFDCQASVDLFDMWVEAIPFEFLPAE